MKYKMKKIKKYQATRRLRKESEYKEPLSSPVPRTREKPWNVSFKAFLFCMKASFLAGKRSFCAEIRKGVQNAPEKKTFLFSGAFAFLHGAYSLRYA